MSTLRELKGVGAKTEEKLVALGIQNPEDLLLYLPKTYLNLTMVNEVNITENGDFALFLLKITKKSPIIKKGNRTIATLHGEVDGTKISLIFYNRDYILSSIKLGLYYRAYGKLIVEGTRRCFINPQIEEESPSPRLAGILPIYTTKGEIPQQTFRNIIADALISTAVLPALPAADTDLQLRTALLMVHQPQSLEDAKCGCERVLLEKTLREMLKYREEKAKLCLLRERRYHCDKDTLEQAKRSLPFALNESQIVAIDTMLDRFDREELYNGILTGDVGSGKTVVAFLAAYYVIRSGYQSVMMAPTELVAAQHLQSAEKFLAPLGVRSALLTSAIKGKARAELLKSLADGTIDFLVGTHSVLSEEVVMPNLAFAVIDEQHRFGVGARNTLFRKASRLDTLLMSATPIPRTVKLLHMGEHEVLTLSPRHESGNIKTRIVLQDKRQDMLSYLANKAKNGSLCYMIVPQISDMEGIPTRGAEEMCRDFAKSFPDVPTEILVGKMGFAEKIAASERFRKGAARVLVATTVVEVGLDISGADNIVIMHADRFGLATLHQLRGRVGREGQEAYCFLYTEQEEEVPRLKILTETNDGMKLAEADFRMRGAGEIVGTTQHGKDKMLAGVSEEILLKAKALLALRLI